MSANFEVYRTAQRLAKACRAVHESLKAECLEALDKDLLKQWPEPINGNQRWVVGGTKWAGKLLEFRKQFPVLNGLTLAFTDEIVNAGYSVLLPGAEIAPHRGYSKAVVRMHYGLEVPKGDLGLLVDGHKLFWHEKEAVIFDDTLEHSAWNRTNQIRAVVLFDLKKSES